LLVNDFKLTVSIGLGVLPRLLDHRLPSGYCHLLPDYSGQEHQLDTPHRWCQHTVRSIGCSEQLQGKPAGLGLKEQRDLVDHLPLLRGDTNAERVGRRNARSRTNLRDSAYSFSCLVPEKPMCWNTMEAHGIDVSAFIPGALSCLGQVLVPDTNPGHGNVSIQTHEV
jgi:hypothetical protein